MALPTCEPSAGRPRSLPPILIEGTVDKELSGPDLGETATFNGGESQTATQTVTVIFVGGNADGRELALTPGRGGFLPLEQLFLGCLYLFDHQSRTYRYHPSAELNGNENRFD